MCFVSYLRLSKQVEGKNQYGMESQRQAIANYVSGLNGDRPIIAEYIEWETGSRKRKCPQLKAAIRKCEETGAELLIMKIDRLGRNLHQITSILESNVSFTAVATPNLDRFGLHILGAVAEKELADISDRIIRALQVKKQQGHKLGATKTRAKAMSKKAAAIRGKEADEWALEAYKTIRIVEGKMRGKMSDVRIADKLNRQRFFTREGNLWYPMQVGRVRKRIQRIEREAVNV